MLEPWAPTIRISSTANGSTLSDGKWVDALGGETFENRNPADWEEVIGVFPKSTKEDVDRAVEAATEAQKEWSRVPVPIRGAILTKAADLLVERKDEYARDMTREMGKVLTETLGDVQEAIDTGYYAGSEGRRYFGRTVPSELPDKVEPYRASCPTRSPSRPICRWGWSV